MIYFYTDGSALTNPGPGGFAVVVTDKSKLLEYHAYPLEDTTNNRAELLAAITAMRLMRDTASRTDAGLVLVSDSKYVLNGIKKINTMCCEAYQRPNRDLWLQCREALRGIGRAIKTSWVPGHAQCDANNLCDKLAYAAAKKRKEIAWTGTQS